MKLIGMSSRWGGETEFLALTIPILIEEKETLRAQNQKLFHPM